MIFATQYILVSMANAKTLSTISSVFVILHGLDQNVIRKITAQYHLVWPILYALILMEDTRVCKLIKLACNLASTSFWIDFEIRSLLLLFIEDCLLPKKS